MVVRIHSAPDWPKVNDMKRHRILTAPYNHDGLKWELSSLLLLVIVEDGGDGFTALWNNKNRPYRFILLHKTNVHHLQRRGFWLLQFVKRLLLKAIGACGFIEFVELKVWELITYRWTSFKATWTVVYSLRGYLAEMVFLWGGLWRRSLCVDNSTDTIRREGNECWSQLCGPSAEPLVISTATGAGVWCCSDPEIKVRPGLFFGLAFMWSYLQCDLYWDGASEQCIVSAHTPSPLGHGLDLLIDN